MCGICGVVTREADHPWLAEERLIAMRDTMTHRGPDSAGLMRDAQVSFAQRRLSIIDLSRAGVQPMSSPDRRIWVLNNGEIYNYRDLRTELERAGHRFVSASDTESIVHAYRHWGLNCLIHLRGMFGLALWDVDQRRLLLARDRAGEKPLYYSLSPEGIQFASEIKALLADRSRIWRINPQAVSDYLAYRAVPAPLTIFEDIYKLPQAHALLYDANSGEHRIWQYWQWPVSDAAPRMDYQEAVEMVRGALSEAVRLCLMSDVPLGALLSGGIDSSAIVALMARHSRTPVKTFSVGFAVAAYDESHAAQQVADHFETEHTAVLLEPQEMTDLLPRLAAQFDEPFADSSALPTYLICKVARQKVTVALSGDGGDEAFAGYSRYTSSLQEYRMSQRIPAVVRHTLVPLALRLLPAHLRGWRKLERLILEREAQYERAIMLFTPGEQRALLRKDWAIRPRPMVQQFAAQMRGMPFVAAMQYADMNMYLPEDVLVKVDRTSMLNSLEVRAPFLDHPLLEAIAPLPWEWLYKKRLLKDALRGLLPDAVLNRPKMGFEIPLEAWFKGSFGAYARDVLLDPQAKIHALVQSEAIRALLRRSGVLQSHQIWGLLMLEGWAQHYWDSSVTG